MVYGEYRAMEFAFVRNGREETDREKIRAFAEAYGLVLCGELAGANVGRLWPEKTAERLGRGDTLIVADAAALGSRYEEALQAVSLAVRQGVSLYCVKEGLRIDALFPQTFDRTAEICLQLYKAVLSIRNKGIQEELKRAGKKRGRPFGTAVVSSLDGRADEISGGLRQGLAKAEIARRLGVGRTTLYLYLKRKGNAEQGVAGAEGTGGTRGVAGAGRAGGMKAVAGAGRTGGTRRVAGAGELREWAEEKTDFRPTKQFMTGAEHEH